MTRLALGVVTLLAMSVVVFLLIRLKGDPLDILMGSVFFSPEDRAQLSRALGLDKPLVIQYLLFLSNAVRGDFGVSVIQHRPVSEIVFERVPATFELAAAAIILGILIGGPLGVASAVYRNSPIDAIARIIAMLGQSLPAFVSGIVLIWIFAVTLHWLPTSGRAGLQSYVLPSLAIAWFMASGVTRLVRSSLLEVLHSDYITFARSKGVPERTVIWHHALRNALLPTLTFLGLILGSLLTGSVVVENLFAWPGIGRTAIIAVQSGDYPVVQMVVILYALVFVIVNLAVDLLTAYLNPRIRYA